MQAVKRGVAALCMAVAGALAGQAHASGEMKALSPWDAQLYAAAFDEAHNGRHDAAAEKVAQASDKALAGHVEVLRLLSPTGPKVSYEDLAAWLDANPDHPEADRVFSLAKRRKPDGAAELKAPISIPGMGLLRRVFKGGSLADQPRPYNPTTESRRAREAFYSGETRRAHELAVLSGERWIAGLAAFRLGDYVDALRRFESIARDDGEGAWLRSGGAYWASRSAIAAGSPELAPDFLRMAARTPHTFYGLIAERQLGLQSNVSGDEARGFAQEIAALANPVEQVVGFDELALVRLMKADVRAKRAVALSQLGMATDAGHELRAGLLGAKTNDERRQWTTLALTLNAPVTTNVDTRTVRGVDADDFPTPRLTPRGGFSVDKAMVYAIVRQESRFNADAHSHAGARGLMQLMPATAAFISGDDRLKSDTRALRDPATNLRLGQDYFKHLLEYQSPQGDMLRAVAAYNGGQRAVNRAVETAGGDLDPLMLIESLPAQETRDYVEKVVSGYWIYRRIFGEDSATLDAVASGRRSAELKLDR